MMNLLILTNKFTSSQELRKNGPIILSVILLFFFISSVIALTYLKTLISLRFNSDDYSQFLDSTPIQKEKLEVFYHSKNTVVFNTEINTVDNVIDKLISNKFFNNDSDLHFTFSNKVLKEKFYRAINGLDSGDISDNFLKKLIVSQSKSTISSGKVCFINKCIESFIAFKTTPKNKKEI